MMRRLVPWTFALFVLTLTGVLLTQVTNPLLLGQSANSAPTTPAVEPASFRHVVKQVLPAVVSIESKAKPISKSKQPNLPRRRLPDHMLIPEEFRRFFEEFEQFELPERTPVQGFGSGFIVDPKGVILTNNHVVAGADQVEVQLMDGRKFMSTEIRTDPKTDLAIVRIDPKGNLPFLVLGDSDAMEIGDRVLAAGAPFGLKGSVTHGIISAKGRNGLNMNMYEDFLQTDAAINPGNSGGPLVNLEGKVIGINSVIKTVSGGFQGVGLAISSNLARNVMTQLLKDGVVKRGYLGIQIKDLTDPELAARLGVQDRGILVTHVFENAPAAKGGMRDGDVIVSVAGKPVQDSRDLQRIVAGLPIGQPAKVQVVRDGQPLTLDVTIENQPEDFGTTRVPVPRLPHQEPTSTSIERLGFDVADLTPQLAQQLGYKEQTRGAVVTELHRGGLAEQAGIRRGMLIVKVDRETILSAAALREAVERANLEKGILLQVQTPQGGTNYILLKQEAAVK